jgi:hypothetical protein
MGAWLPRHLRRAPETRETSVNRGVAPGQAELQADVGDDQPETAKSEVQPTPWGKSMR